MRYSALQSLPITGDHSKEGQILVGRRGKYTRFCIYRQSCSLWPPVIANVLIHSWRLVYYLVLVWLWDGTLKRAKPENDPKRWSRTQTALTLRIELMLIRDTFSTMWRVDAPAAGGVATAAWSHALREESTTIINNSQVCRCHEM